jgi:hypothetical protein
MRTLLRNARLILQDRARLSVMQGGRWVTGRWLGASPPA